MTLARPLVSPDFRAVLGRSIPASAHSGALLVRAVRKFRLPQLGAAFASLTGFEPMGDSQCCWIRPGMRSPSAHQLGFRIDPESDGDQRQYKNDDNGSHGPVCRTRIRRNTGALTQRSPPVRVRFAGCMGRLIPAASRLFNCASVSRNICCGTDFPSHAGYI
jgi:hypothetical protein